tara:strand:+ start:669 stop:977 length:309 start_codon:yes stop_codon:yes gene_type:complete
MSKQSEGLSKKQAKVVERAIVGFSILSLVFLFQPFSMSLYSIGCIAVVVGGLSFNLVPLCVEGVKPSQLIKIAIIIFIILIIVAILAVGSAELYSWYLASSR